MSGVGTPAASRRAGRLVAVVVLVLGLAGCSAPLGLAGSRPGAPAGRTEWAGPTSGEHLLVSDGRLYSEQLDSGAGACFWFVSSAGTVVSLTWPPRWRAAGGPLHVVDPEGRTVASTFDEGLGFTGHYEAGRTGCAPGGLSRSFVVSSVAQVGVAGS